MPRVKERSKVAHEVQEQCYAKALEGLDDGTYRTLGEAAESNHLSKSSLGHRKRTAIAPGSPPDRTNLLPGDREGHIKADFKVRRLWISPKSGYFDGVGKASRC